MARRRSLVRRCPARAPLPAPNGGSFHPTERGPRAAQQSPTRPLISRWIALPWKRLLNERLHRARLVPELLIVVASQQYDLTA